ncbi:MAG: DUF4230 domain-containing protein, partial [Candidatus Levybacteria bacterium]|nr:DUF4230 domain-containing protein [Candidatus Levybacteria bacterium]
MLKSRFVWIFGAALLILVSVLLIFFAFNRFFPPFLVNIDTSRTAVVKQMRSLARLETAVFTIEKVIDGGTTGGNIFQRLLFGDKILLIAHGQVIAGFDLSQISEKDIIIEEKNVTVKLPAPTILVSTLDNSQTKVYDRQKGLLNDDDTLESQVRQAAEASIRDAACDAGILQQASDNGRKQLTALFTSLGFETITFEIP